MLLAGWWNESCVCTLFHSAAAFTCDFLGIKGKCGFLPLREEIKDCRGGLYVVRGCHWGITGRKEMVCRGLRAFFFKWNVNGVCKIRFQAKIRRKTTFIYIYICQLLVENVL